MVVHHPVKMTGVGSNPTGDAIKFNCKYRCVYSVVVRTPACEAGRLSSNLNRHTNAYNELSTGLIFD